MDHKEFAEHHGIPPAGRIHDSGQGGERLRVTSYGNGTAYNVEFGEAGAPTRNLYFQGDDATELSNELDALEQLFPETPTRDLWMLALDPYM